MADAFVIVLNAKKKGWRYGHISVSVHKLTTKMFYSSILYRLMVQMNCVYKSKSITVYLH